MQEQFMIKKHNAPGSNSFRFSRSIYSNTYVIKLNYRIEDKQQCESEGNALGKFQSDL